MGKTSVVCVKVNDIRPEYKDLKDWDSYENNIYIGRKGIVFILNENGVKERYPKKDSIWANPFKVGKDGNLEEVLNKYKKYIKNKLYDNDDLQSKLLNLSGCNLGCWCINTKKCDGNLKCHGQILIQLMRKYRNK